MKIVMAGIVAGTAMSTEITLDIPDKLIEQYASDELDMIEREYAAEVVRDNAANRL